MHFNYTLLFVVIVIVVVFVVVVVVVEYYTFSFVCGQWSVQCVLRKTKSKNKSLTGDRHCLTDM